MILLQYVLSCHKISNAEDLDLEAWVKAEIKVCLWRPPFSPLPLSKNFKYCQQNPSYGFKDKKQREMPLCCKSECSLSFLLQWCIIFSNSLGLLGLQDLPSIFHWNISQILRIFNFPKYCVHEILDKKKFGGQEIYVRNIWAENYRRKTVRYQPNPNLTLEDFPSRKKSASWHNSRLNCRDM